MRKLLAAALLTVLLSVSALAGDINVPPAPAPESLIVQIVLLIIG